MPMRRLTLSLLFVFGVPVVAAARQAAPPGPLPVEPSTRLLFGPTARMQAPGDVYAAVYGLFLPFVQVGVTERFSIGAGAPVFVIASGDARFFWVTPKFQLRHTTSNTLSVGTLSAFAPGEGGIGLAYVVSTQEAGRNAFTVGAGWAYSTTDDDLRWSTGAPAILLGAERRLSRRVTLLSENYLVWDAVMASIALRVQGRRLSGDFGLLVFVWDGDAIGGPAINFAWRF